MMTVEFDIVLGCDECPQLNVSKYANNCDNSFTKMVFAPPRHQARVGVILPLKVGSTSQSNMLVVEGEWSLENQKGNVVVHSWGVELVVDQDFGDRDFLKNEAEKEK